MNDMKLRNQPPTSTKYSKIEFMIDAPITMLLTCKAEKRRNLMSRRQLLLQQGNWSVNHKLVFEYLVDIGGRFLNVI